jgi:hypothetical protein
VRRPTAAALRSGIAATVASAKEIGLGVWEALTIFKLEPQFHALEPSIEGVRPNPHHAPATIELCFRFFISLETRGSSLRVAISRMSNRFGGSIYVNSGVERTRLEWISPDNVGMPTGISNPPVG